MATPLLQQTLERFEADITAEEAAISPFARYPAPTLISYNTAKLSGLLVPRTLSFAANTNSAPSLRPSEQANMNEGKKSRRRRSSSLLYQEPPESIEHISDQAASPNLNAGWVNAKGE